VGHKGSGVGRVDMVHFDAHVRAQVGEETVRATVDVVSGDELVAGLEDASDDVKTGHAGGNGESMFS